MNSIFATTAPIGKGHGGGIVSYYELKAMISVLKPIYEQEHPHDDKIFIPQIISPDIDINSIEKPGIRLDNKYYPDNPFMQEYIALDKLGYAKYDISFVNGAPWNILRQLSEKMIVDCPAHNLEESIDEFRRQGINYPFMHMTDKYLYKLYTRFIQTADVIICPSRMSADYLKKNPGTDADVEVIPHGVELPKDEDIKPFPDLFTVGYIGASGPDKGLSYLYKAWAGLQYREAKLLLAGASIQKEGLPPYMSKTAYTVTGKIADTAVFYNDISVYVQPSVTEGFGLPVLEAMSYGRPVIVTEGAGVSELIKDGVEGYVVPIRRPDIIADRIDWLKRHPETLLNMGSLAMVRAKEYEWSRIQSCYEQLIADVL